MNNRCGTLIALEGIDGAGKTTQVTRLEALLRGGYLNVVRTKEPTDGQWGRQLRESATKGRLSAEDELELFLRDRREHVDTLIRPALDAGKVVLVDRYYFSTVAYQGARGLNPTDLLARNEAFAPAPDLLVILDVDPRIGLERIGQRGDRANAFENEENLKIAAGIFRAMNFPYLMRINGTLPPDAIAFAILEVLYDGPLAEPKRPLDSVMGRMRTNGELWTELGRQTDVRR